MESPETFQAVIGSISPRDLLQIQQAYGELEKAAYHRDKILEFIRGAYQLEQFDQIDLTNGHIFRPTEKPAENVAAEPIELVPSGKKKKLAKES